MITIYTLVLNYFLCSKIVRDWLKVECETIQWQLKCLLSFIRSRVCICVFVKYCRIFLFINVTFLHQVRVNEVSHGAVENHINWKHHLLTTNTHNGFRHHLFYHFVFCQMFCLKLILVLSIFRAHCTYLTKFDIWIYVAVSMDMYIFSLTAWRLNTPLYCSRVIRWACLPFCLQLQQWHPKQFSASWLAPNGGCDRTLKPPSCASALRMSRSWKISLHY